MVVFAGRCVMHRAPIIGAAYQVDQGHLCPHHADIVEANGFCVLIETGWDLAPEHVRRSYAMIRVANFETQGDHDAGWEALRPLAFMSVRQRLFCLELEVFGDLRDELQAIGRSRAIEVATAAARAYGREPILCMRPAPIGALPDEALEQLSQQERTTRCDECGAPVPLRFLCGPEGEICPYLSADRARRRDARRRALAVPAPDPGSRRLAEPRRQSPLGWLGGERRLRLGDAALLCGVRSAPPPSTRPGGRALRSLRSGGDRDRRIRGSAHRAVAPRTRARAEAERTQLRARRGR